MHEGYGARGELYGGAFVRRIKMMTGTRTNSTTCV